MVHFMMLSDLYGRIGQILKEHGDAPIGDFVIPALEGVANLDVLIKPKYVEIAQCTSEIADLKVKTYSIEVYNK